MTAGLIIAGAFGRIDHRRMIHDLKDSLGLFAPSLASRNGMAPPHAILAQLGGDILYARVSDAGGWGVRYNRDLHDVLSRCEYWRAFHGALRVSWLHAALVLGRRDLYDRFLDPRGLRIEEAMRWLTLYGIEEHGLWRFIDRKFVADLRRRVIPAPGGLVSPLDMILIGERDDLARGLIAGSPEFVRRMDQWILQNGVHEYKLFWALSEAVCDTMLATRAARERLAERGAAVSAQRLVEGHAQRKIDIFIDEGAFKESALGSTTCTTSAERTRLLAGPTDETTAADDSAPPLARLPLNADCATVLDFVLGGSGPQPSTIGYMGPPTANGAAMLSSNVAFFFGSPRSRHVFVLIDIKLIAPDARLLVLINGRPTDLFSAESLGGRWAKVHFAATPGEPLTVEIEHLPDDPTKLRAGPIAWLKSIIVFVVQRGVA